MFYYVQKISSYFEKKIVICLESDRACIFGVHNLKMTSLRVHSLKMTSLKKKVIDFLAKLGHFKSFEMKSENDKFESY